MQRISISSTPSCSTVASGVDDIESLGDLYIWGEVWFDGGSADSDTNTYPSKTDILIPKPLETDVVLDVHQISCGVRHVAIVSRQGEVFTWGEESGGRLGHGTQKDVNQPQIVESLSVTNIDFVACGEYHTCAISTSGDLFTWGDSTLVAGLLGQGTEVSHWTPKRVAGPLDGVQIMSIACGTWHSAIITSSGKLFTCGDGTFGALGHGDRESVAYPREVQHLSRMRTIKVACGVWHTAAIVEIATGTGPNPTMAPRKLFTWGDGDKYRLGHGSKESYLLPTCISSLVDYNFHKIGCGHTLTVALTTSGHVFTMGSNSYGQLGNPNAEGKAPCLVQEKLVGEFVEDIACGDYHVVILTSRSEVYSWGKGANGRLGHGDVEDRKSPKLIEALKDRHVKGIACGSNFSSSICIHKWVSGADQSVCCGCRQAFGFTRKRHNCYNCGLVHCSACSSRKALKAALAPTPNKPHRVCDACYNKLKSNATVGGSNFTKKVTAPRRSIDASIRMDRDELKSASILPSPSVEPVKYHEVRNQKAESVSIVRASQVPSSRRMQDIGFPSSLSTLQSNTKALAAAPLAPVLPIYDSSSRLSTKKPGPPAAATPLSSRGVIESYRKSNEALSEEVEKLQNQIKTLRQKYKAQQEEKKISQHHSKEATVLASDPSTKPEVQKEVRKLVTRQLKEIIEKMPLDIRESDGFKAMKREVESFLDENDTRSSVHESGEPSHQGQIRGPMVFEANSAQDVIPAENSKTSQGSKTASKDTAEHSESLAPDDTVDTSDIPQSSGSGLQGNSEPPAIDGQEPETGKGTRTMPPRSSTLRSDRGTETIEQFEPGVYVTVIQLRNGAKIFKRVKFSKRRFIEHQAEEWWKENKERVLKKYPPPQQTH